MKQAELTAIIDEWSAAVADLAKEAPAKKKARLNKATGDMLNAFAATATEMAAHTVGVLTAAVDSLSDRITVEELNIGELREDLHNLAEDGESTKDEIEHLDQQAQATERRVEKLEEEQ